MKDIDLADTKLIVTIRVLIGIDLISIGLISIGLISIGLIGIGLIGIGQPRHQADVKFTQYC
jgi:hypothetical protein